MRRFGGFAFYVLVIANIALLAFLVRPYLFTEAPEPVPRGLGGKDFVDAVKWTVYVGLNDKDAGRPLVTREEARVRLNAVAASHVDGFTVADAEGYWTNSEGKAEHEGTLIYSFLDMTEAQAAAMAEEMKKALNQESVLLERYDTLCVFY